MFKLQGWMLMLVLSRQAVQACQRNHRKDCLQQRCQKQCQLVRHLLVLVAVLCRTPLLPSRQRLSAVNMPLAHTARLLLMVLL